VLYRCLKKLLLCFSIASCLIFSTLSHADSQLPDIGTAGVSALSVEQEVLYGKAFMRFARASLPIIDDPKPSGEPKEKNPNLITQAIILISITFLIPNFLRKKGIVKMNKVSEI
jgi:hypothetical protein